MDNIDNIDEYSVEDLLQILQIEDPTKQKILSQTNFYIDKYAETNTELAEFFTKAQKKLLGFIESPSYDTTQGDEWRENQFLPNSPQNEKVERPQEAEIFDNSNHIFMKRKQLGINQEYEVPVVPGAINPNQKNTFTRIINIDSQFRQNNVPSSKGVTYDEISKPVSLSTWSSTDFSLDLSDPLTNVLSLKLYSLQIPFSWYNIPSGLNCFHVKCGNGETQLVTIPEGNYSLGTLKDALNNSSVPLITSLCENEKGISFDFDYLTGKFYITKTINDKVTITFWKNINDVSCETNCDISPKVNNNLGWLLGFRDASYTLEAGGPIPPPQPSLSELKDAIKKKHAVLAESVPNLNGPKYVIIMLEDFNTNRINKGLVTIQDTEARLSLPKYYQPGNVNQLQVNPPVCTTPQPTAPYPDDTYVSTPVYSQGTPAIITQKQQYSLNEIIKNRKNVTNEKLCAPSTTNVFAIVPIRSAGKPFGELITEFSGPLPLNIRGYFGPVDIERMRVTLYDDKGNIMNLNGADWSFTMISEHLYQY